MNHFYRLYRTLKFNMLIVLLLLLLTGKSTMAQTTGYTSVTISTASTSNGSWSPAFAVGAGPYYFTPSGAIATANVNVTEIVTRMGGLNANLSYCNNVIITTTNASGTGTGDISVNTPMNIPNYILDSSTPLYLDLTLQANRNITISTSSAIDFTAAQPARSLPGRPANSLTLIAGSTVNTGSVSILSSITLKGGVPGTSTPGSGGNGGNGGILTISTGSQGSVSVGANLICDGNNQQGTLGTTGGVGGQISITGNNGITITQNISTNGGGASSTTYTNGNGGSIIINDGAITVTIGGSTNDGQTAGIISAIAGTGGTAGIGGYLTKSGNGIFLLSQPNTYSGGTILNAGQLNINHATAIGSGTFTINGGVIDNTTSGSITLSNNNAQN